MTECVTVTWLDNEQPRDLNAHLRDGHTLVGYGVVMDEGHIMHCALIMKPVR